MGGVMDMLSGGAARRQRQQMEAQQRTSLAQLAAQQAEVDQSSGTGGRKRGRGLLTFVEGSLGGPGAATLG